MSKFDFGGVDWSKNDGEIAKQVGCSKAWVQQKRPDKYRPAKTTWTESQISLLGRMPDTDVGNVIGRPVHVVRVKRNALGIAKFGKRAPKNDRHYRPCVVCGNWFTVPPSGKTVCCSKACSTIRRKKTRKGTEWSPDKRKKIKGVQTKNLEKGTTAASEKARLNPASHHEAKIWHIVDPNGKTHLVANLRVWLRETLGDEKGRKIYAGLRAVAQCLRGKVERGASHAKGWRIAHLPEEVGKILDRSWEGI